MNSLKKVARVLRKCFIHSIFGLKGLFLGKGGGKEQFFPEKIGTLETK